MTNSKPFILSALLCLTFTVGMISYLLISDVPEKNPYPQSEDHGINLPSVTGCPEQRHG